MLFPWSKISHRRELLAQPFPVAWAGYLSANVALYRSLSAHEQTKLGDITRVLVAEKNWEGCAGLALTEEIQVTIAAQAALLVLGFEGEYYPNVETVLVYPQGFLVTVRRPGVGGVIVEQTVPYAGEAAQRGPVVVSWADTLQGGRQAGTATTSSCTSSRTSWTCATARRTGRPICGTGRRSRRGRA